MDEIISLIRSIIPIIVIIASILSRNKKSDSKKQKDINRRKAYTPKDSNAGNYIKVNDYVKGKKVVSNVNEDYYSDYSYTTDKKLEYRSKPKIKGIEERLKDYTKYDKSIIEKTEIKDSIDISLEFDKEDMIKGFIMSEILSKPKCLQKR